MNLEEMDWAVARQGDVLAFADETLPTALLNMGASTTFAIVSQSCDIVRPQDVRVTVAPVVEVPANLVSTARRGSMPQFVLLPGLAEAKFIDLSRPAAVLKAELAGCRRSPGVNPFNLQDVRNVSQRIGRYFSRFAFPDDIVPWLRPLQIIAAERANNPDSAIGRVLDDLELRVSTGDWNARPVELTLHVIVQAEALREPLGDVGEVPKGVGSGHALTTLNEVAERLRPSGGHSALNADEEWALLEQFAELLASRCRPSARDRGDPVVASAVSEVLAVVRGEDEFSLALYRRSEGLDVDYLSPAPVGL